MHLTELCRNHGSHFEKHKVAFEEGGGLDDAMAEGADETGSISGSEEMTEKPGPPKDEAPPV